MKPIKIGILGAGSFARAFTPLFKAHPLTRAVSLTDRLPDRLAAEAAHASIVETHASFDDLLRSDCDAIAIFTQRDTHAPFALRALRAGKHVYSAVPAGISLDEIAEVEATVRATGLIYMLGETSYYYPSTLFCRELWRRGLFGRFVYGEGEYMHDMAHGFYEAYQYSGGPEWKRAAGVPPMFYPTHTASMIVSVTGARLTHVSCLGQVDRATVRGKRACPTARRWTFTRAWPPSTPPGACPQRSRVSTTVTTARTSFWWTTSCAPASRAPCRPITSGLPPATTCLVWSHTRRP